MKCFQCNNNAVIALQHGALCKNHFINYFEEKVFKTFKKYNLIAQNDKVCVACSGGKDSQTALYLTKKYLQNNHLKTELFALAIEEGIKNYREKTLKDLKQFCKKENITLHIISSKKEFGFTLDQAVKKIKHQKPCHICGVWRRYLLNKGARNYGATKLITGHNLDDESQAITMNIFKANTSLLSHLGPISGIIEHKLFVRRVKPLYFCPEKETKLYSIIKKFPVQFIECPYAEEGYRAHIRDMLNDFENRYKGTKQSIINSFLAIAPVLKEKEINNNNSLLLCLKCKEPANQEICHACKIKESLNK